jgi:hypothetical protein
VYPCGGDESLHKLKQARNKALFVPSRSTVAATILCLVLLALLAVVQVAHTHTFESDADHCPLCIVLHTIIPVAATAAAIILVPVRAPAPVSDERPALRPWGVSLFTRPPPFAC